MSRNAPPTVLIIGYVWPEPTSSAAGTRMIQLIRMMREQNWNVHFCSASQPSENAFALSSIGVQESVIPLNDSRFDDFIAQIQPDYVVFDRFLMEEQFGWRVEQACPKAVRILDTEDLQFLRRARHEALKQQADVTTVHLHNELAQREIASIYRSDLTLIISRFEMTLLQSQFGVPDNLLHYLPFVFDRSELVDKQYPAFEERQHFAHIGTFKHEPNWDSVLYLKTKIWPRIRKALPAAELHIYGSYTPPKASQLHNAKEGFIVKGWAADALQTLSQYRVLLAPLRFGAGLKGKLADAMLTDTPSITTSIGAEGMTNDQGHWPGHITDDADTFCEQAISLYSNPISWEKCSQLGRSWLQKNFNLQDYDATFLHRVEHLRSDLENHRLHNFTGMMLRHHSNQSTKYMSQWIESKNRLKAILDNQTV